MKSMTIVKAAAALLLGAAPSLCGAEVPRQADAKAQLKYAAGLKKGLRGLKGEERRTVLQSIAEAYAVVGRFFPEAVTETAEASFRLGETRRTLGDRDGAMAAFERTVELKGHRRFGARAMLEIGHLYRRAKKLPDAAATYEKTAKEYSDLPDQRDAAWLWVGKVRFAMKDALAARAAWSLVAEKSTDPLDQIRAYDLIAGSFLAEGKTTEAQAAVEKCQHALAPVAEEPSSRGSRVKRALERMKSLNKLSPAVADASEEEDEEDEG